MTPAEMTARAAGFYTAAERLAVTTSQKAQETRFCGMKIVGTPIMPEGYAALVHETGAVIFGPNGVWTIPADFAALTTGENDD